MNAHSRKYSLLRGNSMESIALIGQVVGKGVFVGDAREIIIHVQASDEIEDPEAQYVTQSHRQHHEGGHHGAARPVKADIILTDSATTRTRPPRTARTP